MSSLLTAADFCYELIQILDLEYPFSDAMVYSVRAVKQTEESDGMDNVA